MTAFQAVDKGSIPLSRTIMRIRNYFFLALALVIIGVIGFSRSNSLPIQAVKSEPIVVTPDLNQEKGIEVKASTSSVSLSDRNMKSSLGLVIFTLKVEGKTS